ncbi:MAG: hypothetical protein ACLRS8_06095 [Parabacteroides merdae]
MALRVRSESLADMLGSLTQYAAHQLGGITRKVTLFAVPDIHLSDLRIVTELDDDYKDADLKVYLSVTNSSDEIQKDVSVRLSLSGLACCPEPAYSGNYRRVFLERLVDWQSRFSG